MTETLRLDDQKLVRRVYDDLGRRNLLRDDMITLLVSRQDRDTGVALEIADVPPDPPRFEQVQLTRPLLQRLVEQEDIDWAALVVCRPGGTKICGGDLAWHDAFAAACRVAGVRDCGTYVATARGAVGPIVPAQPG